MALGCGIAAVCLLLCCSSGLFWAWRSVEQARKELAEADRLWESGQKADAVVKYSAVLSYNMKQVPTDAEKPIVYQRIIDFELERGNADAARSLVEKALDKKVEIAPGSKATNDLVAQVCADRERREAAERGRKETEEKRRQEVQEAEVKRRQEDRDAEAKRREEERKNAPRLSAELVAVRLKPFRTATGLDTQMVYVDWKNTGNRSIRALSVKIRGYDSRDAEVDVMPVPDYYIYATAGNDRPGIAPGETYIEPAGEGHPIPPLLSKRVARVTVTIVKVEETVR